jgi:hypothetical protein
LKPATKKITSFSLLLLGLTPLLFVIFFLIQQKVIRHQMQSKLRKEELQQVVIAEKDVIWVDKHEIRLHGHMFDIYTRELNNGIYTFTGLYDGIETELMRHIGHFNEEDRVIAQVLKFFLGIFFSPPPHTFPAFFQRFYLCHTDSPALPGQYIAIPTPPPQV